jgi:hypothetical protein
LEHLSREAIEALVMGVPVAESGEVRRHLAGCTFCAGRLAREAQLEMLLHSAATASASDVAATRELTGRRTRQVILRAAAALLVLAGGALWLQRVQRAPAPRAQTMQAGQRSKLAPERDFTAPGMDVESPRDYGLRTELYVPCLEPGTTIRPHASDSL